MAHPHQEHRGHKVERRRVHHIAGVSETPPMHRARGGKVTHGDEAEDRALIRKEVKGSALKHDGDKPKHRADKAHRARGGHVRHKAKSGKTNVNVIVAPSGGHAPTPGLGAMAAPPVAPPPMPPKPPMAVPPGTMGAPPPPPGGLGGMPIRSNGGRAYKKGGAVKRGMHADKSGKMSGEKHKCRAAGGKVSAADVKGRTGIGTRTPIQHSGNKGDTQNIGRGPVITRATGGPIYADGRNGKEMAPKLPAGAGSGIGRAAKNKIARREHWER